MDNDIEKEIAKTDNFKKLQEKKAIIGKASFIREIKRDLGTQIKEDVANMYAKKPKESAIKRFFRKLLKKF